MDQKLPNEILQWVLKYCDMYVFAALGVNVQHDYFKETVFRQGGASIVLEEILDKGADIRALFAIKNCVPPEIAICKAVATRNINILKRVCILWGTRFSNSGSMLAEKLKFTWAVNNVDCDYPMDPYQLNAYYVSAGELDEIDTTLPNALRNVAMEDLHRLDHSMLEQYTKHLDTWDKLSVYIKAGYVNEARTILNLKIQDYSIDSFFKECSFGIRNQLYTVFPTDLDDWCIKNYGKSFTEKNREEMKLANKHKAATPEELELYTAIDNQDIPKLQQYDHDEIIRKIHASIDRDEIFTKLGISANELFIYWPNEYTYDLSTIEPDSELAIRMFELGNTQLNTQLIEQGLFTLQNYLHADMDGRYLRLSLETLVAFCKKYGSKETSDLYENIILFNGSRESIIWLLNHCADTDYQTYKIFSSCPDVFKHYLHFTYPFCEMQVKYNGDGTYSRDAASIDMDRLTEILNELDAMNALYEYYSDKRCRTSLIK